MSTNFIGPISHGDFVRRTGMWMKTGAFLPFMLFLFFPSVRAVIPKEEAFQGIPTSQDAPLAITDSSGQEYLFRALKTRRTVKK